MTKILTGEFAAEKGEGVGRFEESGDAQAVFGYGFGPNHEFMYWFGPKDTPVDKLTAEGSFYCQLIDGSSYIGQYPITRRKHWLQRVVGAIPRGWIFGLSVVSVIFLSDVIKYERAHQWLACIFFAIALMGAAGAIVIEIKVEKANV